MSVKFNYLAELLQPGLTQTKCMFCETCEGEEGDYVEMNNLEESSD